MIVASDGAFPFAQGILTPGSPWIARIPNTAVGSGDGNAANALMDQFAPIAGTYRANMTFLTAAEEWTMAVVALSPP